jgi:2-isopropylmalate synthase
MENKPEYNWSTENLGNIDGIKKCDVVDETLRDGLQSTSVKDPVVADKIEMLHHMAATGVQAANLGFPAAHKRQREDVLTLVREISESAIPITPQCAARCQIADIVPIAEIAQETGQSIEVGLFVSVSEIRRQLRRWTQIEICRALENSITFAISKNLSVMFVAEDATRTSPLLLSEVCRTALASGARRICVADTVGCATPRLSILFDD